MKYYEIPKGTCDSIIFEVLFSLTQAKEKSDIDKISELTKTLEMLRRIPLCDECYEERRGTI